jgi:hypothetical protein
LRTRLGLLILLLAVPMMGFGQSTLNFPRAFTVSDLGATGFAVVNPGGSPATATFTLYSASGAAIGTSTQIVPATGQLAKLGTELFASASQAGWVQLTSATNGLQGFWLGGDFSSYTDGAEAAGTATDVIFPLVTQSTEINIANPGASTNSVTIRLFGEGGTELAAAATRSITGNGVFQGQASALFPSANLENARYIRVTGQGAVTGTAVITGYLVNPSSGVTNAVSAASQFIEANFPHVVSGAGGGGNYTTVVGVTNLDSSSNNVSITFTPEDGTAPTTVTRTISANGALRDTAQNLFSFPSGFKNGWVRILGSGALTGFVAYADSVAGGLAVVPVSNTARTSLMFGHIADLAPWLTGIALLNTNSSNATIDVYAMTPAGTLIGGADTIPTARFTLAAGQKTAKLLSELIPQTQTRTGDGGFVFVRSTQPLYGIELFFTRNLSILSNVAAGDGAGYTPPSVAVTPTLTSIAPTSAARGATITLAGTGFSSTPSNNTVVFTAAPAAGTVNATAVSASSTSLTVVVPATAVSGAVYVSVGGLNSSSRILEVVASSTTVLEPATITVAGGSTTSSVDIIVPPPASGLNLTGVGVGDAGSAISFSSSSAEIAKGESKQMLLAGTGLSGSTTVSVTGAGVTLTGVQFQQGFIFVNIAVAASAPAGARNVVVTNSNRDIAIMTGGLIVR